MSDAANLNAADPAKTNYDAEQLAEEIETGEAAAPQVNADADYERSKQFAVADVDRDTKADSSAASGSGNSGSGKSCSGESGDPASFLKMAEQVTPDSES